MNEPRNETILIVSGLPRCGTSMMMKMLEAGGIEPVVDNIRKSDEDNPRGYYEFEKVKKIDKDASWLGETRGKVFKMVSMLLYHLPAGYRYKVIFMKRRMEEMLASQKKMLERKGVQPKQSDGQMTRLYGDHLMDIEKWLQGRKDIEVLYVHYNEVLSDPASNAKRVHEFLGDPLNEDEMVRVIDPSLYRQRKPASAS